jgi:hypothetical protein
MTNNESKLRINDPTKLLNMFQGDNFQLDTQQKIKRIIQCTIAKKIKKYFQCGYNPNEKDSNEKSLSEDAQFEYCTSSPKFQPETCFVTSSDRPIEMSKVSLAAVTAPEGKGKIEIPAKHYIDTVMRFHELREFESQPMLHEVIAKRYLNSAVGSAGIVTLMLIYKPMERVIFCKLVLRKDKLSPDTIEYLDKELNKDNLYQKGHRKNVTLQNEPGNIQFYEIEIKKEAPFTDSMYLGYIFNTILVDKVLKNCEQDIVFFPVTERISTMFGLEGHALFMIIQRIDKKNNRYAATLFDPLTGKNQVGEFLQKCLNKSNNHSNQITIYQQDKNCPLNFQTTWNNPKSFCVAYSLMWFDCIMNTLYNIELYNQKYPDNKIQVPLNSWSQIVSETLNKFSNINETISDEKMLILKSLDESIHFNPHEILLRFLNKLIEDFKIAYPKDANILEEHIVKSFQKDTSFLKVEIPDETGTGFTKKIYMLPSKHTAALQLEHSDISKIENPFFAPNTRLNPENSRNLNIERESEHLALKELLKENFYKDCKLDTDCVSDVNPNVQMKCDKMDDNEYGYCIPKKKSIKEECSNNDDCLSNFCHKNECRSQFYRDNHDTRLELDDEYTYLQKLYKIDKKRAGDQCTNDSDCISDNCFENKCKRLLPDDEYTYLQKLYGINKKRAGDQCNNDSDCISDNCFENKCKRLLPDEIKKYYFTEFLNTQERTPTDKNKALGNLDFSKEFRETPKYIPYKPENKALGNLDFLEEFKEKPKYMMDELDMDEPDMDD